MLEAIRLNPPLLLSNHLIAWRTVRTQQNCVRPKCRSNLTHEHERPSRALLIVPPAYLDPCLHSHLVAHQTPVASYFISGRCHRGRACLFMHDTEARDKVRLEAGDTAGADGTTPTSNTMSDKNAK